MSDCPECGLPPAVTTQDVENQKPYYECKNRHVWPAEPDTGTVE